jgi:hypothetical protein
MDSRSSDADRLAGFAGHARFARDFEHLRQGIDLELRKSRDLILQELAARGLSLMPTTPVGAVVLVGTVFVGNPGMPITVQQLAAFRTDSADGRSRAVGDALASRFGPGPDAFPPEWTRPVTAQDG